MKGIKSCARALCSAARRSALRSLSARPSLGAAPPWPRTRPSSGKGAPEFTNDDVKFKVRGRIYEDYVFQEVDGEYDAVTNPSGTGDYETRNGRLRTARLGVEGQLELAVGLQGRGQLHPEPGRSGRI